MGPSALGTPPLRSRETANLATVFTAWFGLKATRASPVAGSTWKTPPSTSKTGSHRRLFPDPADADPRAVAPITIRILT